MKKEIIISSIIAIVITLLGCQVCSTKVSTHIMVQWAIMMWLFTFVAAVITFTVLDDYKEGYKPDDSWCFLVLSWLMPTCMFLLLVI